ncbi:ATP-grasp domain-containing protein [Streptomyces sp. SP17BM10]|uniref:ATP-grasp domain-containing protein n=1 Tax=Streptomyces sp. SP17BM10 TaxID=3002530 RepID=UPI002E79EB4F|nr:ATP-grasp domain-containing protein [Streptomyces sp. SP17BM10]MEE1783591.1 ATP-grasp domain-containing protein [Streptomyces sp. SP17BM10]
MSTVNASGPAPSRTRAHTSGAADAVLLLAPRINETGLQLRTAAGRRGLRAFTAPSWQAPEELLHASAPVHVYGGPLFGDAVGRALGLALLEPAATWLGDLPRELTGRRVSCTTLAEARKLRAPAFVKPPADKVFAARVYEDGSALPGPGVLDGDTPVQVSEVVRFRREYRLFVLDGTVRAASRYAVDGELSVAPLGADEGEVLAFAADVLAADALATDGSGLPSAAVVDVGPTDGGWAVVEANAAWASGGYAADPDGVLDVVLRAAGPLARLPSTDRPFLRDLPEIVR